MKWRLSIVLQDHSLNKEQNGMFGATIVFRWAALFQIFLLLITKSSTIVPLETSYALLGITLLYTTVLTILRNNIAIDKRAILLLLMFDIAFSFALMTIGGGWRNAWYIYSFSTGLMAAVFFKVFGALVVSLMLCLLYLASLLINGMTISDMLVPDMSDQIISNFASYLLSGCFFGYPAILIDKLNKTKFELQEKNKQLKEADILMAELKNNSENLKEVMTTILEPRSILKLLVAKQKQPVSEHDVGEDKPSNDVKLTKRELEFLKLLAQGKNNSEIAVLMHISKRTVETHRKNVFQKLGANSAANALLTAIHNNIIDGQAISQDELLV